ncbi:MFS transporter [Enterorhabdus sp. P55]|uniref:MFS transporter n=1 Tax=Enterorhabdus sp. P55 TaxID=2304571 RepID=UPI00136BDEF5|nr:MFS transporter [Enterorhabdus sp. P55]NBI32187.1 MFS transporter [Enterorhabdus sp. P55]
MSQATAAPESGIVKKVALSSFLGNFIEWFDYGSYAYYAVIISAVLFSADDPDTADLIGTFAVFAISFVMRPIGALFWGSMGDKKGRKWTLSVSIFLMSGATFLIGCLPTYAAIGFGAPLLLLLLRMIQGFSAAGEYAGAATFLAEYAPTKKRGLYCSLVPASTAVGLLAASALAFATTALLSQEAVLGWGWRIPFLLAGPLGFIAHYIRTKLEDSPTYQAMQEVVSGEEGDTPHPVRDLFRGHLRELIISFGACTLNAVGFYAVLTYLPTYLETAVGMPTGEAQMATNIALVVYVAFIFISGKMSDRFGRKKMLVTACVLFVLLTVPAFMILNTAQFGLVLLAELALCFILTLNDGTLSSYLTETFPTEMRYTGFALSFNLANAIFGGTAPMISTWLIAVTGSTMSPAWYMVAVALVALVAMALSHENSHKHLDEI